MAGQFISHRVRARKRVAGRRPSLMRRLGAMTAVVWALIGWVEFGPKRPLATAPAPQEAIVIAPAVQADAPRAAPLPVADAAPPRRAATRRARPSIPLTGDDASADANDLYVLSAAELAEISQAAPQ